MREREKERERTRKFDKIKSCLELLNNPLWKYQKVKPSFLIVYPHKVLKNSVIKFVLNRLKKNVFVIGIETRE